MIDLHVHILPGLDDGPVSLEGSVAMARAASAAGTRAMATTSHINRGFGLSPAELAAARDELAAELDREQVELELLSGGEISPDRLVDLDDDTLRALALGGGPYVLLECPFVPVGEAMEPMVEELYERGHAVLLAHPERSPTFQREPERLAALVRRGALTQVTSGSFRGEFGDVPRRAATAMLERGLVHVLASDGHDATHRPPDLLDTGLDEALHEWMTGAAPAAIVAGDPLPERPALRASPRR